MAPRKMVNVHEAKTHLSRLLKDAHAGVEITIAKAGKPYARLVPLERATSRKLGFVEVTVDDDAFAPLSRDELQSWYGSPLVSQGDKPRKTARRK